MKIIRAKRGEGKTSQLLKESAELNIPIVVPSYSLKERLMENANVNGYNIPTPLTFFDGPLPEKILVDNAEYTLPLLVEYFLGAKVECETISIEN